MKMIAVERIRQQQQDESQRGRRQRQPANPARSIAIEQPAGHQLAGDPGQSRDAGINRGRVAIDTDRLEDGYLVHHQRNGDEHDDEGRYRDAPKCGAAPCLGNGQTRGPGHQGLAVFHAGIGSACLAAGIIAVAQPEQAQHQRQRPPAQPKPDKGHTPALRRDQPVGQWRRDRLCNALPESTSPIASPRPASNALATAAVQTVDLVASAAMA